MWKYRSAPKVKITAEKKILELKKFKGKVLANGNKRLPDHVR